MPVALDHLRRHRRGLQAQPRADLFLRFRADVRERPHRARNLAHAQIFRRGAQPRQIAPGLFVPDGELQAERDGLGVNAVRAADLHRVLELERAALQHLAQRFETAQQNRRRLLQLQRLRGIHHVVRRQPVVQPARCFRVSRPRPWSRPPRW